MKMYNVESSNITQVGYDVPEERLYVRFTNGTLYRYCDVPASMFTELLQAESVGKFFIATIKRFPDKYPFEKVEG